jgi:ABC-type bacteriocin/lantibiotic exporter with double-glycine peptidase domain
MKKIFGILLISVFVFSCEYKSDFNSSIKGGDGTSCRYVESASLSDDVTIDVPYCSENNYGPYAVLAMVLSFYGSTGHNYLNFDINNFNEEKIKEKALSLGFFASILDCGFLNLLDAVDRTNVPVIVKIKENNQEKFLLVVGFNKNEEFLRILDPSDVLRKKMTFSYFKNTWEECDKTMIIVRSGS